jgi:hypothetical protein
MDPTVPELTDNSLDSVEVPVFDSSVQLAATDHHPVITGYQRLSLFLGEVYVGVRLERSNADTCLRLE